MKITRNNRRAGFLALILAGCLAGAIAAPCRAAGAAPGAAGPIGSINLDKILAGYTKKAALDGQIQDLNDKLTARFKEVSASDMLTRDQQQKYVALLDKASQSDADKAAITALKAQSKKDADELVALQQKQNPTHADKARLDTLTNQQQAARQSLQEIGEQYSEQIKAAQDKMSTQLTDTVSAAVAAVAKDKGLSAVFTSQIAIYTSNDITDDVLKKLNK
jgi:Skp family chaperone for outer membrane proteins